MHTVTNSSITIYTPEKTRIHVIACIDMYYHVIIDTVGCKKITVGYNTSLQVHLFDFKMKLFLKYIHKIKRSRYRLRLILWIYFRKSFILKSKRCTCREVL